MNSPATIKRTIQTTINKHTALLILTALVMGAFSLNTKAEIYLSAPSMVGQESYLIGQHHQLASKLSNMIHDDVVLDESDNWSEYNQKLFNDTFDIHIAPAHITAYTLPYERGIQATYLGQFENNQQYFIAVKASSHIQKAADLNTEAVCVQPLQTLSRAQVMRTFNNPVLQPQFVEIKGTVHTLLKNYLIGNCSAAIINQTTFDQYNRQHPDTPLKKVHRMPVAPNSSIFVSNRLKPEQQQILNDYFRSATFSQEFPELFNFYSPNSTKILPFKESDYSASDFLLDIL